MVWPLPTNAGCGEIATEIDRLEEEDEQPMKEQDKDTRQTRRAILSDVIIYFFRTN